MQTITLVAGVSGVGKSTLIGALEGLKFLPEHAVTISKFAKIHNISEEEALQKLIENERGFVYELSLNQSNVDRFFEKIEGKNYAIVMYYIGLNSEKESIARIERRVLTQHVNDVPAAQVLEEFMQRFQWIQTMLARVDKAEFFDNTTGFVGVAEYSDGKLRVKDSVEIPWVQALQACINPEDIAKKKAEWNDLMFGRKEQKGEEKQLGKGNVCNSDVGDRLGKKTGVGGLFARFFGRNSRGN